MALVGKEDSSPATFMTIHCINQLQVSNLGLIFTRQPGRQPNTGHCVHRYRTLRLQTSLLPKCWTQVFATARAVSCSFSKYIIRAMILIPYLFHKDLIKLPVWKGWTHNNNHLQSIFLSPVVSTLPPTVQLSLWSTTATPHFTGSKQYTVM